MAYILLATYIIILAAQITSLVFAIKKKTTKLWVGTFVSEIIPLILSIITMLYFNNLPGYGFMPGLSYLGEILFSFCAAALYTIMILISFIVFLCLNKRKKKNKI